MVLKDIKKDVSIFTFGGLVYCLLEIIWRRYTHWTMAITGGLCFLVLFKIYTKFKNMALVSKCFIGSFVITTIEFISGCIVNLWLKMNVWDYSKLPMNIMGQICLPYSFLWGLISIPINCISKKINKRRHNIAIYKNLI